MKVEELRVSYNPNQNWMDKPLLNNSNVIAEYIRPKFRRTINFREQIWIILLTKSLRPKGAVKLSEGSTDACIADMKIALAVALKTLSTCFIIVHNHPSGHCGPDDTDKKLTRELAKAAEIMGMQLLDHIILIKAGHYSFADSGLL